MNNDQIIKKIERGIDEAPINKMDQIKAAKVEKMAKHDHITKQPAKKLPIYKVAAIAAIFLFAFLGYRYQYVTPDTMVYLDVNPSFEIGINRAGKVVEVEAVNDDAKAVIESLSLDKMSIEEVVEAITHKLVEMDYLRSDQNMILVSVYNKNEDKRIAQSDTIEKVIKIELEKDLIESVVLSQSISVKSDDDDDDNLDVSRGKMHFINTLLSMDSTLNKQDLASMSIQELVVVANRSDFSLNDYFTESEVKAIKQILFSDDDDDSDDDSDDIKGTRITLDVAKTIALNRVKGTIVDMDQDNDEYKFEITLDGKKYEIEINAYTGKIIKVEMDEDDDSDDDVDTTASASQNDDNSNNGQQGPRITPDAARASALKSVNGTIVKMEEEDYEFEFEISLEGTIYKVKVHAYTGLVTKVEMEDDDDSDDDDDEDVDVDTNTGATPIGDDSDDDWDDDDDESDTDDDSADDSDDQGTRITLEAAKAIALGRVKGTIVKTEQEDDKFEFEIELEGTLYKIEVHAYTGNIIKVEMEESEDDSEDDSEEDDSEDDD